MTTNSTETTTTTAPVSTPSVDEQRAALAAQSEHLAEQIRQLTEQRDSVTARLRDLGPGPAGARADGSPREVVVEQPLRFDPTLARDLLDPYLYASIVVEQVDSKLAQRVLPPAAYDACKAPYGKARVTIK